MGRAPCCDQGNVKKGPWSPEEDEKLKEYIEKNGTGGNWIALPHKVGLRRCGKSCRLRWLNYLRPNIKHGQFSQDEDKIICTLFANIGSRWSIIAAQLPGRTDNDIKNYWNTKLKKKLILPATYNNNNKIIGGPINPTTLFPPNNPSLHSQIPPPYDQCGNTNFSHTTPIRVYDDHQPNFIPPNPNNGIFVGSIIDQPNYSHHHPNRMLAFGRGSDHHQQQQQPSCTSSDGSCITNNHIISDHDQNYCTFQSYLSNNINGAFDDQQNHEKFMFSNDQVIINTVVDHSIEEIKELISTNHHMCSNNLNSFFVDEMIKIEDKVLDNY